MALVKEKTKNLKPTTWSMKYEMRGGNGEMRGT